MPKVVDALTETVINAPPEVVYKEILDLFAGDSQWHIPNTVKEHRSNTPLGKVGAIYDIKISGTGVAVKINSKITKIVENKLIEFEEGGDFAGTATWIFEPLDGKTDLKFRWNARPNTLLFKVFLNLFISPEKIEKNHIETNLQGFKLLNEYLNKN
jgi:hypothetical protein